MLKAFLTVMMLALPVFGAVTDTDLRPLPDAPALPEAGKTYVDPVFKTLIMRVTDESDGKNNQNAYSYWPSFNKDCSYFHITTSNLGPTLYSFDPAGFKLLKKEKLFAGKTPNGTLPVWEDSIWSGRDSDSLFCSEGPRLWSYNVKTKAYTLLKDFSEMLPGEKIWQLSRSVDDEVFGFTRKDLIKNNVKGYAVWKRSTDTLPANKNQTELDEVQVDKSGKYLVVKSGKQGRGVINVHVIDLQSSSVSDLLDDGPDYSPGHSDSGMGCLVGEDNYLNRFLFRKLASPHSFTALLTRKKDWSQGAHLSFLTDDESMILVSNYTANKSPCSGLFKDEIFLLATDGSGRVKRICHHRSDYLKTKEYWDSPRANISRNGKFVVYTSNWGASGRRDVFIAKIPD
ncbi:MAG: hypothetical protein WCI43_00565 [Candidatus Firestonebacteria bacterium]